MKPTLLVIALLLGFLTRAYEFQSRFIYGHDNDLASWIIKDILVDKHPRLIGQLTSSPGIFIGGLYYYSLIPFYLATGMDPIGSVASSWIIGLLSIGSIYFVFNRLYSHSHGQIASLLYAASYTLSATEREVVPTTPVMLWSIWFFYAINKLFRGEKKYLWILAILFALVWHLNLALGLLFPLVLIGVFVNRQKYRWRDYIFPLILVFVLSLPLVFFESRHNFLQTKALISTLTTATPGVKSVPKSEKLFTTINYSARNINGIFHKFNLPIILYWILPTIVAVILIKSRSTRLLNIIWLGLYILFFTLHPIRLSEYYLNGLNILWIAAGTMVLAQLDRRISAVLLTGFLFINLNYLFTVNYTKSGYSQKKDIVNIIKTDAAVHGYPCVAISYITDTGYNLGYRYFFWHAGLKTKRPDSGSPIYSIVFPQSIVDRLDMSSGAIGLVLPEYSRYTNFQVSQSCLGDDANLTEPMFGFTK
jgi:hypothetical protein